jgi:hypothetical protein
MTLNLRTPFTVCLMLDESYSVGYVLRASWGPGCQGSARVGKRLTSRGRPIGRWDGLPGLTSRFVLAVGWGWHTVTA